MKQGDKDTRQPDCLCCQAVIETPQYRPRNVGNKLDDAGEVDTHPQYYYVRYDMLPHQAFQYDDAAFAIDTTYSKLACSQA